MRSIARMVWPGSATACSTRVVGLAARMRLHVRVAAAEQLAGALDGRAFHHVDIRRPRVITLAGIAFDGLVVRIEPCTSSTARLTMFSEAISSITVARALLLVGDGLRDHGVGGRDAGAEVAGGKQRDGAHGGISGCTRRWRMTCMLTQLGHAAALACVRIDRHFHEGPPP